MASLRNISVSESDIYRIIHHRGGQAQQSHGALLQHDTGSESGDAETSRWAFLKRLLEIEEVHEKRRRARERQERALRQATLKPLPVRGAANQSASNTSSTDLDPMSQWLTGQVLAQTLEDTHSTEASDKAIDSTFTNSRLPAVSEHPNSLRSSSDQGRPQQLLAVSLRNGEFPTDTRYSAGTRGSQCGPAASVLDPHYDDTERRSHHQTSITGLLNTPGVHQEGVDGVISAHQSLTARQAVEHQGRLACRGRPPTPAAKKTRQLRLPPILLPRVYTVQPRPLKSLEFPAPTKLPGPITEVEWEDLQDCRYIRHLTPRKNLHRV